MAVSAPQEFDMDLKYSTSNHWPLPELSDNIPKWPTEKTPYRISQWPMPEPSTEIPVANSAVVVIPTLGNCEKAVLSVYHQEGYKPDILLVYDGPTAKTVNLPGLNVHSIRLPWNVGAAGFYGHRVYAAISHLVDHSAIFFLDEDNTFERNHVSTCLSKLNEGYDFVFSHRNIISASDQFLARDRFEAIGKDPINLVDTSTYCFRRNWLLQFGHLWHHGWGADRRFFQLVRNSAKWTTTGEATLNYRLDGNPGSPTIDFFRNGNKKAGYTENGLEIHSWSNRELHD
jgi:hypothetical protein